MSVFRVEVSSRARLESGAEPSMPYVLVSITDPGKAKFALPDSVLRRAWIEVTFHDAKNDPPRDGVRLISQAEVADVWRGVALARELGTGVCVACEFGMSRSPAVAAGILEALGLDASGVIQGKFPNPLVRERVRQGRPE